MKKLFGLSLVLFILLVGSGCAHVDVAQHMLSQPAIKVDGLPRIKIDEAASLMVLKHISSAEAPKQDVVRTVNAIWNQKSVASEGDGAPARVIIEGKSLNSRGSAAIISNELIALYTGGSFFLFGIPTAWDTESVTLRLQIGPKEYVATDTGKCWANMYQPKDPAPCAFSKALTGALRRIADDVMSGNVAGQDANLVNAAKAATGQSEGGRKW